MKGKNHVGFYDTVVDKSIPKELKKSTYATLWNYYKNGADFEQINNALSCFLWFADEIPAKMLCANGFANKCLTNFSLTLFFSLYMIGKGNAESMDNICHSIKQMSINDKEKFDAFCVEFQSIGNDEKYSNDCNLKSTHHLENHLFAGDLPFVPACINIIQKYVSPKDIK